MLDQILWSDYVKIKAERKKKVTHGDTLLLRHERHADLSVEPTHINQHLLVIQGSKRAGKCYRHKDEEPLNVLSACLLKMRITEKGRDPTVKKIGAGGGSTVLSPREDFHCTFRCNQNV